MTKKGGVSVMTSRSGIAPIEQAFGRSADMALRTPG
jgi:hypothetical protein